MTSEEVKLLLKIQTDTKGLVSAQKQFGQLRNTLGEIGQMTKLGGIFAAAGLGIQGFSNRVQQAVGFSSQLATQLERNQRQLQLNAEASQVYGRILVRVGGSQNDLNNAIKTSNKIIGDAEAGQQGATDMLRRYGLEVSHLASLAPEKQLEAIAHAIMALPTLTQRSAAAQALFSDSGQILLPVLERLASEGYGGLKREAEETAGVLSGEMASALTGAANDAQDAEAKLGNSLSGINLTLQKSRIAATNFTADYWKSFALAGAAFGGLELGDYISDQVTAEAVTRRQIAAIDDETAALKSQERTLGALVAAERNLQLAKARTLDNGISSRTGVKSASQSASVFMLEASATRAANKIGIVRTAVQGLGGAFKTILLSPFTWITAGAGLASAAISGMESSLLLAISRSNAESEKLYGNLKRIHTELTSIRTESEADAARAGLVGQITQLMELSRTQVLTGTKEMGYTYGLRPEQATALRIARATLDSFDRKRGQLLSTNQAEAAAADRLSAAKAITAELNRQLSTYEKSREAAQYTAADEDGKLSILNKQFNAAVATYETDQAAARLAKDTAAETAALVKFEATVLAIAQKRAGVEKTISDEKTKQTAEIDAQLKAFFDSVNSGSAQRTIQQSDDALRVFGSQRGRIDGNPYLTEREARAARIASLRAENREIEHQIANLRIRQQFAQDPDTLQGQIRALGERSSANNLSIGQNSEPLRGLERFQLQLRATGQEADNTFDLLEAGVNGLSTGFIDALTSAEDFGDGAEKILSSFGLSVANAIMQIVAMKAAMGIMSFGAGLFTGGVTTAGGVVTSGSSLATSVIAGGGGSFVTNGLTSFTVGDNPGGRELVSVIPLSGRGQSKINGQNIAMAGGGMAMVNSLPGYSPGSPLSGSPGQGSGTGGDTLNFFYTFQSGVTRQEVAALIPAIESRTLAKVEERARRRT